MAFFVFDSETFQQREFDLILLDPPFQRPRHLAAALVPECFFGLLLGLSHRANLAGNSRKRKPLVPDRWCTQ